MQEIGNAQQDVSETCGKESLAFILYVVQGKVFIQERLVCGERSFKMSLYYVKGEAEVLESVLKIIVGSISNGSLNVAVQKKENSYCNDDFIVLFIDLDFYNDGHITYILTMVVVQGIHCYYDIGHENEGQDT